MSKNKVSHTPGQIGIIEHDTLPDCCEIAIGAGYERETLAVGLKRKHAAFIVRACNSHDELLAILQDVGEWLETHLRRGNIKAGTANQNGDLVSQIRTAIAKAEGRGN